jgi:hypothetical protein
LKEKILRGCEDMDAEKKESTVITEKHIQELVAKIQEAIEQKEKEGKKDRSVKVETESELLVRITRNPETNRFFLSISPKGGHPVHNKVIFDSSQKLKDFVNSLKNFLKEREDILLALDTLNKTSKKGGGDTV